MFVAANALTAFGQQTVGLFYNDGATPGYNLFSPNRGAGTYLIDNDGNLINQWIDPDGYSPGASTYLTEDGTLLKACFVDDAFQIGGGGGGRGGLIREYAWQPGPDGKAVVIWQYRYNNENVLQHHDFHKLPNGNILITAYEKSAEHPGNWEHLVEIKPNYRNWDRSSLPAHGVGGQIVWEWHMLDHLVPAGKDPAQYPYLWDSALGATRINAVDYDPQLNQILLSTNNEIWVIDKYSNVDLFFYGLLKRLFSRYFGDSADSILAEIYGRPGDLLYRWGDPATYLGPAASGMQTSFGQHGVNWIKRFDDYGYRLPNSAGVGNVLFFNNGYPGGSEVQEFAPPIRRNGSYPRPATGQAYDPNGPIWGYGSPEMASPFLSSAQRLPTGNTLIAGGTSGTFLEVTPGGTIVWKYVSPVANTSSTDPGSKTDDDIVLWDTDSIPPAGIPGVTANMVFRVKRYAPNYRGFHRKNLRPLGELIGLPPSS